MTNAEKLYEKMKNLSKEIDEVAKRERESPTYSYFVSQKEHDNLVSVLGEDTVKKLGLTIVGGCIEDADIFKNNIVRIKNLNKDDLKLALPPVNSCPVNYRELEQRICYILAEDKEKIDE
jgi:hypothetical protein